MGKDEEAEEVPTEVIQYKQLTASAALAHDNSSARARLPGGEGGVAYDRDKIRESVCRESIGNIAEAKERFEPRSEVGRPTEGVSHAKTLRRCFTFGETCVVACWPYLPWHAATCFCLFNLQSRTKELHCCLVNGVEVAKIAKSRLRNHVRFED
ncbi:unnamed protein product [Heligmosomoides polygyrus]|uniref:Uncharacterized protein n=1 Tax=Heligmosomoides polygyrus TaxID=6339 RepID=A0A183GHV4_HELPZ|nr:unnamed protein product [Heligmosomoides polygyrus]